MQGLGGGLLTFSLEYFIYTLQRPVFVVCPLCTVLLYVYCFLCTVVPQNMDIWAWEKYYKAAKVEAQVDTIHNICD